MNTSALKVENLETVIGRKTILKKINFLANTGEFIGIIGPNGAGKSTLLRSVRGILKPAGGEVKVFDTSIKELTDKKIARSIAYMQQNINLDFGFTALETVLAGRYCYLNWWENEREEDYKIAREYLSFMGVNFLAEKSVKEVSGGERQRIFLAKALAQETPLVFLDEPTSNLDLNYQEEIFRYCRLICQHVHEKKLVMMVAHDVRMAAKFCSRLILLAQGEIIADGVPEKVVTAENLKKAYGFNSLVFKDPVSGNLDFYIYQNKDQVWSKGQVYILGAGSASSDWIRLLFEKGFQLSGSIFCHGEIDAATAQIFNVNAHFVTSYTEISEPILQTAQKKQAETDWTLLPEITYHPQNLYLLNLALAAKTVIIIENTPIQTRDFTNGAATALYETLLKSPRVKRFKSFDFLRAVHGGRVTLGENFL
ncbi:MAG: ABC transporter ATP-binding protein [Sporomusaceae bacterium]|jgi:iron complex transport system ATP-binding protein|nr:ABC transporter ATP-binding protein [Sporomusaceae bacterium]